MEAEVRRILQAAVAPAEAENLIEILARHREAGGYRPTQEEIEEDLALFQRVREESRTAPEPPVFDNADRASADEKGFCWIRMSPRNL